MVTACEQPLPLLVEFDGAQRPGYIYLDSAPGRLAYVGVRSDLIEGVAYTFREAGDPHADYDSPEFLRWSWMSAVGVAFAIMSPQPRGKHVGV